MRTRAMTRGPAHQRDRQSQRDSYDPSMDDVHFLGPSFFPLVGLAPTKGKEAIPDPGIALQIDVAPAVDSPDCPRRTPQEQYEERHPVGSLA